MCYANQVAWSRLDIVSRSPLTIAATYSIFNVGLSWQAFLLSDPERARTSKFGWFDVICTFYPHLATILASVRSRASWMVAAPPSRHCLGPTRMLKGPWSMVREAQDATGIWGGTIQRRRPGLTWGRASGSGMVTWVICHWVMPLSQQENHGPKSRGSRYMSIFTSVFLPFCLPLDVSVVPKQPEMARSRAGGPGTANSICFSPSSVTMAWSPPMKASW